MHFLNENLVMRISESHNRWDSVGTLALFYHVVSDNIGDFPIDLFLFLFQLLVSMT